MTARASCAHDGQHGLQSIGDPFQVDSHQPLPVGRPAAQDRPQNTDAGVQAEDVDGAETVASRLDGIEPGLPVGDIQLTRHQPASVAAQVVLGMSEVVVPHIGHDHIHPPVEECFGNAEADAAGTSGDERRIARHRGVGAHVRTPRSLVPRAFPCADPASYLIAHVLDATTKRHALPHRENLCMFWQVGVRCITVRRSQKEHRRETTSPRFGSRKPTPTERTKR